MFTKIYNFWHILRSTLWFTPALFCAFSVLLISGIYGFETFYLSADYSVPSYLYKGTIEESRDLVGLLLSAMITMTTLVISITIVVLSLASSQLGPRLIKSFMADHTTQNYIGLFFGSIIGCFIMIRILHGGDIGTDVRPQLSISFLIFYVFANMFVLLFFVHHVAESCIADNVVGRVSINLVNAIDRLAPHKNEDIKVKRDALPEQLLKDGKRLKFTHGGYIQTIGYADLLKIANENDIYIKVELKAGRFVIAGQSGIEVWPETRIDAKLEKSILDAVVIGGQRTPTQDPEYSMRHLIEIALRALSPGINDPYTAASVIDHLCEALSRLFAQETDLHRYYDSQGLLRVEGIPILDSELVDMAFNQIRQAAKNRPDITIHLLRGIANLAPLARTEEHKEALRKQARMLKEQTDQDVINELDYMDILEEYKTAMNDF